MNKTQKSILFIGCCFFIIFIFIPHSHASFKRDMKKAKKFIASGIYQQAIILLEKAVLEHPANAEVHFLLGVAYINNDNFKYVDFVFASAVAREPDYENDVGIEYKKAADKAYMRGNLHSACILFERAVEYAPNLGERIGHSLYASLGDKAGNAEYYEKCNLNSQDQSQTQLEDGPIKLTGQKRSNPKPEIVKSEINQVAAYPVSKEVAASHYWKVVFEKTYSFTNAFELTYGQVKTIRFYKDDVRVGDQIEVITYLEDGGKFSGKEIGIWNGDLNNLEWATTKNGYYLESVNETQKGSFTISLAKRRDIKVIVRVKRKMVDESSIALVESY